jgi:hypothetical protein
LDLDLRSGDYRETDWEGWSIAKQAQFRRIPIIIVSSHAGAIRISNAFRTYNVLHFFFDKLEFRDQINTFEKILIDAIFQDKEQLSSQEPNKSAPISRYSLRKLIMEMFNSSELKNLAFDLEINIEVLSGESSADKVRELILYMERQGRMDALIKACEDRRPHVRWR